MTMQADDPEYDLEYPLPKGIRNRLAEQHYLMDGPSAYCVMDWLMDLARARGAGGLLWEAKPDPKRGELGVGVLMLDGHRYRLEVSREPKDQD